MLYALLFKYRDQSNADAGLQSFRVLNLIPPTTNHSEVVQVFGDYKAYKDHLAQSHTVGFRFNVQNSPPSAARAVWGARSTTGSNRPGTGCSTRPGQAAAFRRLSVPQGHYTWSPMWSYCKKAT